MSPSPSEAAGWCSAVLIALPVDHVAISTLVAPFETAVVAASDDLSRTLSECQLDLGVGQAWDALRSRAPVLLPRLSGGPRWPMTTTLMTAHGIASAYAFPMTVGMLAIGAVDLYATTVDALSGRDIVTAREVTRTIARQVLRDAVLDRADDDAPAAAGRRVVHQATGMVMAQVHVSAADALVLIRGHSFAVGRSVSEVSREIVDRRLTLDDGGG